ncbi:MAG TPA: 50S ribosomal protein L11 methyltransferase [Polyangiaceae bacterium]|nr:50S ribosomal protein L11 methyltransferase [Polyangiaceae bacterium]
MQLDPVPYPCADSLALGRHLGSLASGVRLSARPLREVPEMRLWLMTPDYPEGELPRDSMNALLDEPPYWAFCWGSGTVLARWLLDHPDSVRGKTVLDFGAGSGVIAIAAALAGARRVVACDADPRALIAVRANARLNGVSLETCMTFEALVEPVDVLLAADILYDVENFPLLAQFRERAPDVLVADSRVPDFREDGYVEIARAESRVEPDLKESPSVRQVKIYRAVRT